jgi:hypothetical protein
MSTRDDDALDTLIDRVAHDLTAGDPPASLAGHVHARIAGRDRPRWFVAWQPVAATVVLAIGLAAVFRPDPAVDVPAARQEPPPTAGEAPAAVTGGSASSLEVAHGVPSDVERRSGPAGRIRRADVVAIATTTDASPLPAIEPLAVSSIEDPVLVAEMSGLAMPIEIEPLQIVPLELQ